MDLEQKFIEEGAVNLSVFAERKLTSQYPTLKWDIIDVMLALDRVWGSSIIETVGFVVHTDIRELYFAMDVVYQDLNDVIILGFDEITSDAFLDLISEDKYIRYGI